MFWYVVVGFAGMIWGAFLASLVIWRQVTQYRLLWENEKNGNLLMLRRLMALEEERMGFAEGGVDE